MHDNISPEQIKIVDALNNNNVVVNAVAGSGKTTTAIQIVKANPRNNILFLTYNKKLKDETKSKLADYKCCRVHTYHSSASYYYKTNICTDVLLEKVISDDMLIHGTFQFSLLILDESQDLCPLYYEYIVKLIKDNNSAIKMCIMGDIRQCIYKYKGADQRFMLMSEKLFGYLSPFSWMHFELNVSYRIPHKILNFVKQCYIPNYNINSTKLGGEVYYTICNFTTEWVNIANTIIQLIKSGYKPGQIMILAPTTKNNTNRGILSKIANYLSTNLIPIFVSTKQDDSVPENLLNNKCVFITFHQAKGLERDIVFCFNVDSSYNYFSSHKEISDCPNEVYVALTRAKSKLYIVSETGVPFFNFTPYDKVMELSLFSGVAVPNKNVNNSKIMRNLPVTDFVSFLSHRIISDALKLVRIVEIQKEVKDTNIPQYIQYDECTESIADINGIAVPAYFELVNTGKTSIDKKLKKTTISSESLLKAAIRYSVESSGYNYPEYQIKNHNWLSLETLKRYNEDLKKLVSTNAKFEVSKSMNANGINITGRIDCIDGANVYEFKYCRQVKDEHILQLCMYALLLLESDKNTKKESYIINDKNITSGDTIIYVDTRPPKQEKKGIFLKRYKSTTCDILDATGKKIKIFDCQIIESVCHEPQYRFFLYNIMSSNLLEILVTRENLLKINDIIREASYTSDANYTNHYITTLINSISKPEYIVPNAIKSMISDGLRIANCIKIEYQDVLHINSLIRYIKYFHDGSSIISIRYINSQNVQRFEDLVGTLFGVPYKNNLYKCARERPPFKKWAKYNYNFIVIPDSHFMKLQHLIILDHILALCDTHNSPKLVLVKHSMSSEDMYTRFYNRGVVVNIGSSSETKNSKLRIITQGIYQVATLLKVCGENVLCPHILQKKINKNIYNIIEDGKYDKFFNSENIITDSLVVKFVANLTVYEDNVVYSHNNYDSTPYASLIVALSIWSELQIHKFYTYNTSTFELIKYDIGGEKLLNIRDAIYKTASTLDIHSSTKESITRVCNRNQFEKNGLVVVLDIETSMGRDIVQVSYCIIDNHFNVIKSQTFFVNSGNNATDFFGKINSKNIVKYGVHPVCMLLALRADIESCSYLVGHNISFDYSYLFMYSCKYNVYINFPQRLCTMGLSKTTVGLIGSDGKVKYPSLDELYKIATGTNIDNQKYHDATYDVDATIKCLMYLCNNKIIDIGQLFSIN